MENVNVAVATGPVIFDDVVQALGDSDPAGTNASKLRAVIGRGSFATIQKHLDTIRAQRDQALQSAEVKIPDAPPELLSMWGAAVAVAVAQVRTRLDGVVQERDSLAQALASARSDVEALSSELESVTAQADATSSELAAQSSAHAQALHAQEQSATALETELTARVDEAVKLVQVNELQAESNARAIEAIRLIEVSKLQAELAGQVAEATQRVQISELQAKLSAQALQTTIDRLTDQVGELKSLLALQARSPAA